MVTDWDDSARSSENWRNRRPGETGGDVWGPGNWSILCYTRSIDSMHTTFFVISDERQGARFGSAPSVRTLSALDSTICITLI